MNKLTHTEVSKLLFLNENAKPFIEGKSKKIYKLTDNVNFMVFKPHLRSITYNREGNISGTENERLRACLYYMLMIEEAGFNTQILFNEIVTINGMEGILVCDATSIPLEFIGRYYAYGSIAKLFPSLVKEGDKLPALLCKYDLKQDISVNGIDDPTMNESYIVGLGLLTQEDFLKCQNLLKSICQIINSDFAKKDVKFIDVKMEFGFNKEGTIILIDEISQDCMRAEEISTGKTITKDCYRQMKSDEEVLFTYKHFNEIITRQY